MTLSVLPKLLYTGEFFLNTPLNAQTSNLWQDMKIAVYKCSLSNLTELEKFCQDNWAKISGYRCADLIEIYGRRPAAVIAAISGSKYWPGGWIQNMLTIIKWLVRVYMMTALLIVVFFYYYFFLHSFPLSTVITSPCPKLMHIKHVFIVS